MGTIIDKCFNPTTNQTTTKTYTSDELPSSTSTTNIVTGDVHIESNSKPVYQDMGGGWQMQIGGGNITLDYNIFEKNKDLRDNKKIPALQKNVQQLLSLNHMQAAAGDTEIDGLQESIDQITKNIGTLDGQINDLSSTNLTC